MKPVDCIIKNHDEEAGMIGDCHRACIASLLELDAFDVPHFFDYPVADGSDPGLKMQELWLAARGLAFIELPFHPDTKWAKSTDEFLKFVSAYSGETHYMVVGLSIGGHNHSVIAKGDKIVHDPTYGEPHGIVGPCDSGFFWAGWITKL